MSERTLFLASFLEPGVVAALLSYACALVDSGLDPYYVQMWLEEAIAAEVEGVRY